MLVKGFSALLLTLILLLGAGPSSAAEMVPLSDQELEDIVAAGLFFEINLRDGFMRVAIASNIQNFGSNSSGSGGPVITSNGNGNGGSPLPVTLGGNINLNGNAQQNLQAALNANVAGSIAQFFIDILVVQIQNNNAPLNINQIQVGAITF